MKKILLDGSIVLIDEWNGCRDLTKGLWIGGAKEKEERKANHKDDKKPPVRAQACVDVRSFATRFRGLRFFFGYRYVGHREFSKKSKLCESKSGDDFIDAHDNKYPH